MLDDRKSRLLANLAEAYLRVDRIVEAKQTYMRAEAIPDHYGVADPTNIVKGLRPLLVIANWRETHRKFL